MTDEEVEYVIENYCEIVKNILENKLGEVINDFEKMG